MSTDKDEMLKAIADYKGPIERVKRGTRALPLLQPVPWRKAAQNRKKKIGIKGPKAAA